MPRGGGEQGGRFAAEPAQAVGPVFQQRDVGPAEQGWTAGQRLGFGALDIDLHQHRPGEAAGLDQRIDGPGGNRDGRAVRLAIGAAAVGRGPSRTR